MRGVAAGFLIAVFLAASPSLATTRHPSEIQDTGFHQVCGGPSEQNDGLALLSRSRNYCVRAALIYLNEGFHLESFRERLILMSRDGSAGYCESIQMQSSQFPPLSRLAFEQLKSDRVARLSSKLCPGVQCFDTRDSSGRGTELSCAHRNDLLAELFFLWEVPDSKRSLWR